MDARKAIEGLFGMQLPSSKIPINGKYKNFDLVNFENRVVGDVKHYKMTDGGNRPSAKFSTLNEYVWLIQLLEKYDTQHWQKVFVVGEDRQMVNKYIKEFDNWLSVFPHVLLIRLGGWAYGYVSTGRVQVHDDGRKRSGRLQYPYPLFF